MDTTSPTRPGRPPARAHRLRNDEGAVVVEFALMLPFIVLILFGIFDFGMLFRQSQTLITSAQLMARSEANLANTATTDYNSVLGMRASLQSLENTVYDFVIVYKAPQVTGAATPAPPTNACLTAARAQSFTYTGGRVGVSGLCNVYTRGMIDVTSDLTPGAGFQTNPGPPVTCPSTSWHSYWCPTSRVNTQLGNGGLGPDYIGVYVQAEYSPFTTITPTRKVTEYAVYRLEPIPIN